MDLGALGSFSLDWDFFSRLFSIVIIDLILAGDNAVVIAIMDTGIDTGSGAPAIERRVPNPALNLVFPALILAVSFAARYAVRLAKQRYVHPRTGYLSLDRNPAPPRAAALASLAIAAVLAFIAVRAQALHDWIPAVTALVIAPAFLALGHRTGLVRFPLAGLSSALVGFLLSLLHVGENLAIAVLFGWVGFVLVAGGVAALFVYLRHAPPPGADGRATSAPGEP